MIQLLVKDMTTNELSENAIKVGVHRPESPYTDVECEEIIARLEQLLDGEMDKEEEQHFLETVTNCEYCLEQYNIEKSFRKLLKTGLNNVLHSSSLIFNIKSKIRSVRGQVDKQ